MAINIFILDNGLKYEFCMNRNDHSSLRHKLQLPNIFRNILEVAFEFPSVYETKEGVQQSHIPDVMSIEEDL